MRNKLIAIAALLLLVLATASCSFSGLFEKDPGVTVPSTTPAPTTPVPTTPPVTTTKPMSTALPIITESGHWTPRF